MRPGSLRRSAVSVALLAVAGCAGPEPAAGRAPASVPAGGPAPSAASDRGAPEGRRVEVTVSRREVTGDTGRVLVAAGERLTIVVHADVADEVHVHGYDVTAGLAPGIPAELTFDVTVPGVFEVELHETGTVLLTVQVG